MHLVNSSSWIEYLQNSPRADLFAAAIEDHYRQLVPTIALYEVHKILSRILPKAPPATCAMCIVTVTSSMATRKEATSRGSERFLVLQQRLPVARFPALMRIIKREKIKRSASVPCSKTAISFRRIS